MCTLISFLTCHIRIVYILVFHARFRMPRLFHFIRLFNSLLRFAIQREIKNCSQLKEGENPNFINESKNQEN